jgi:hypothetical protein
MIRISSAPVEPDFLLRISIKSIVVDRRGFLPTFSTGSAEKGTRTSQNGISGRVTKRRGFEPLNKPLLIL